MSKWVEIISKPINESTFIVETQTCLCVGVTTRYIRISWKDPHLFQQNQTFGHFLLTSSELHSHAIQNSGVTGWKETVREASPVELLLTTLSDAQHSILRNSTPSVRKSIIRAYFKASTCAFWSLQLLLASSESIDSVPHGAALGCSQKAAKGSDASLHRSARLQRKSRQLLLLDRVLLRLTWSVWHLCQQEETYSCCCKNTASNILLEYFHNINTSEQEVVVCPFILKIMT